MNRNFVEMLHELSAAGVEYLVIGAHAVTAHGYARGTRDIDIWVNPTRENAVRVWRALGAFGAPMLNVTVDDFAVPGMIYQIGIDPARIDILTSPAGLDFETSWRNRFMVKAEGDEFPFLGFEDLIRSKRAAGRPQDLLDIENLKKIQ